MVEAFKDEMSKSLKSSLNNKTTKGDKRDKIGKEEIKELLFTDDNIHK